MSTLTEDVVLSRSRAKSLSTVKRLNCWGSGISDISILRKMPNVEVVTLSVNEISTLEDFAYCPKLKELYLRRNSLTQLESEIQFLKDLPCLKVLWLSDNPCSEEQDYRSTVLKNLPNIEKLDNIEVRPAELDELFTDKANDVVVSNGVKDDESADLEQSESNGTFEQSNGQSSAEELLDQNSKLHTQLGLQPLIMEESSEEVQDSTTTRPVSSGETSPLDCRTQASASKSSNLLAAVLLLLNDMSEDELHVVQKEVDQKLESLHETSLSVERSEVFTT